MSEQASPCVRAVHIRQHKSICCHHHCGSICRCTTTTLGPHGSSVSSPVEKNPDFLPDCENRQFFTKCGQTELRCELLSLRLNIRKRASIINVCRGRTTSWNGRAGRCHHCFALQRTGVGGRPSQWRHLSGVPQRRLGVTGFD